MDRRRLGRRHRNVDFPVGIGPRSWQYIREGEVLDAEALAALIQAAVAENLRSSAPAPVSRDAESSERSAPAPVSRDAESSERSAPAPVNRDAESSERSAGTKPVKLLSGGNPQIAKADGDAPVQAYIAAMPGWKRDLGKRLDAIIGRNVPNVRKAVRWNTPFYGIAGQGWFLGFHSITKYVKVAFFRGASLRPVPPGVSKQKDVRYLDIYEDDQLDEQLVASWIRQASELPGESMF